MRLLYCLALFALAAPAWAADASKPNVIVILSDDVGWGEFGFQGNTQIPTPNIDSIAKNGVRFTNGYVAATYCSPSRAGLMTGRYPTRFGHEFNGGGNAGGKGFGLPLTETTMADRMKALGYATGCVGKWHLGGPPEFLPTKRGFDEYFGTVANPGSYFTPPAFVDSRKSPNPFAVKEPNFYLTDAYGDRAADWIGRQTGPYFLYLAFNAQHAPLHATKKYLDRFLNIKDEKRQKFAAMMAAMEEAVAKVLAKVRERGEEENTLIFFFSDNGGPTQQTTSSNGPLRGFKATTSEGGTRIPYCVQWKGKVPAGKVYDLPVLNLDILPTAVVAAGGAVETSWKLDGVDLMPFITGKNTAKPHETIYWRFGEQWAIRHGDWKLVASRIDKNEPRLINLADDIAEAKDLSAKEPEKVKQLTTMWKAWSVQQEAPRWKPARAAGAEENEDEETAD